MTAKTIKLFSERSHYSRQHRSELADILRPFWKDMPFSDEERKAVYGIFPEEFRLVDNLPESDLAVLPMTWNHYMRQGQCSQSARFIELARQAMKPVLSYISGDEGVTVRSAFDDVFVVRPSGQLSRRRPRQFAQPVFFDDPLKRYPAQASGLVTAAVSARPTVGFCGQASVSAARAATDIVRTACRNLLYRIGLRREEPQPLFSSALLRARAMKVLAESPLVETRFIPRAQYRGGAASPEAREATTREFYQNIAQSDYTLCVRGGGNFSKRFYETLAMGRIPVMIDTDCLLPFEPELDWAKFIVRVPRQRLHSLPKAVADHFAGLGNSALVELKSACRRLWEEELTFGGFHRHLIRIILTSGSPPVTRC